MSKATTVEGLLNSINRLAYDANELIPFYESNVVVIIEGENSRVVTGVTYQEDLGIFELMTREATAEETGADK